MHQNRSHFHHGTAEGSFTPKKWFAHRAGRSPCAHSIGKFFLCYISSFFLLKLPPPARPGTTCILYNILSDKCVNQCHQKIPKLHMLPHKSKVFKYPWPVFTVEQLLVMLVPLAGRPEVQAWPIWPRVSPGCNGCRWFKINRYEKRTIEEFRVVASCKKLKLVCLKGNNIGRTW